MEVYSLDVGGTSIKHGVVAVDEIKSEIVKRMPNINIVTRSFSEVRDHIISAVETYAREVGHCVDVAISTTGAVDRSGLVLNAGFFEGYTNVDWAQILQEALPNLTSRVVTVNDGKASTWAEYQRLGRGTEIFAHFVVGTGVGGGLVCFDQLLYGDDETAGALGHMKVGGESELVCSCGHKGCVETLASSQAISRSFRELLGKDSYLFNNSPTVEETFVAARDGDPRAIRAFELAGEWLGVAISNVINVLNPRYVTIGGGLVLASMELGSGDGGPYLKSAIGRARELAFEDIAEGTIIRPASAGNDGGLLGAAMLCAAVSQGR